MGPGLTIRSEGPLTSNFTLTVLVDASVYMPRHKFNSNQKAKGMNEHMRPELADVEKKSPSDTLGRASIFRSNVTKIGHIADFY